MLANLFGPAGWNAIATRSRLGQRLNWLRAMKKISISNRRESEIHKQQQQQIQISSAFVNKLKQTNCALLLPHSRSRGERAREQERERESVRERERVWWTARRAKSNGDGLILDFSVDAAELKQQLQQQQQRSLSKTRLAKLFCCWKSLRQVAAWTLHRTIKNKQIFYELFKYAQSTNSLKIDNKFCHVDYTMPTHRHDTHAHETVCTYT